MNLKTDILYKFNFNVDGRILTYSGRVISVGDGFVTFLDKFDKEIIYNLNTLVNAEEISE